MNSIALNRIVKKNQRAKVQQLSEIATLFEKEIRVRNQLSEIKQLGNELSNQKDANFNLSSQLPKGFLDQENAKCKQLLNTLSSRQEKMCIEYEQIQIQQTVASQDLKKIETCIDRVEERKRKQKSEADLAKELLESEAYTDYGTIHG